MWPRRSTAATRRACWSRTPWISTTCSCARSTCCACSPSGWRYYRDLFRHVLVDEYQDTNQAQYVLVKLLTEEHRQVTVVGDDDQSVYSWRGADIRNILELRGRLPRRQGGQAGAELPLHHHHPGRGQRSGRPQPRAQAQEPVERPRARASRSTVFECRDEHEEARLVCDEMVKLLRERPASDVAVFYRVNAQSRVMEDMLVRQGVAYRVVGGTKFYQRAEIKDLLAYLRVIINATDDLSLLRVINTPRRGLGDVAIGPPAELRGRERRAAARGAAAGAAEVAGLHQRGRATPACGWGRASASGPRRPRRLRRRRRPRPRGGGEVARACAGAVARPRSPARAPGARGERHGGRPQGRAHPGGRGPRWRTWRSSWEWPRSSTA